MPNSPTSASACSTRTTVPMKEETLVPVGQMMAEYQRAALSAEQQLERDKAILDDYNNNARQRNEWVSQVLGEIAGKDPEQGREGWSRWWTNLQGYAYQPPQETPRPTVVENVPLIDTPRPTPSVTFHSPTGSPVKSEWKFSITPTCRSVASAPAPRSIRSTASEPSNRSKSATRSSRRTSRRAPRLPADHGRPPQPAQPDVTGSSRRRRHASSAARSTGSGRSGQGWVMARDLKAGDTVRHPRRPGPGRVGRHRDRSSPSSTSTSPTPPTSSPDRPRSLVHDNTLPETRLVPFDTELAHR